MKINRHLFDLTETFFTDSMSKKKEIRVRGIFFYLHIFDNTSDRTFENGKFFGLETHFHKSIGPNL